MCIAIFLYPWIFHHFPFQFLILLLQNQGVVMPTWDSDYENHIPTTVHRQCIDTFYYRRQGTKLDKSCVKQKTEMYALEIVSTNVSLNQLFFIITDMVLHIIIATSGYPTIFITYAVLSWSCIHKLCIPQRHDLSCYIINMNSCGS